MKENAFLAYDTRNLQLKQRNQLKYGAFHSKPEMVDVGEKS
jgi:hypothetical protein